MPHGQKLRGGGQIVIPQIVMDGLEKPQSLSGFCIQRDNAVPVEIVARTIAAVEIISSRAEWNEGDASFFIDG